ncbi:photosystem II protein PsbQ [Leptolyngbya sp. FACHB-17]|uniref:photosystem II protein PsbQ n=1 Tax=unclassified Leptolyngbya TaxID=2650499 RepID=UPI0016815878|nr:photosystem II protein PsbQ [Leptolyngbya sp. FACHB-17]MBD2079027.1 photosystem II protein PsbQ [Leptolyngbya sp. FACHB-17]
MAKYRSILALVFCTIMAIVMVGCSSPTAVKPTYTPEKIAEIQSYAKDLSELSDRLPELQNLIQQEDFIFARNFIHGPLGEIRVIMSRVAGSLLPNEQKPARDLAKQIANDLVEIDQASASNNYKEAIRYYGETVKDLEALTKLIPQG